MNARLIGMAVASALAAAATNTRAQGGSRRAPATTARAAGEREFAGWLAAQMVEHDPNYAGSHYAVGMAAETAGDAAKTRQAFASAARLGGRLIPTCLS